MKTQSTREFIGTFYIIFPLLCFIGMILNLLNIVVFLDKRLKYRKQFTYMLAISITDFFYLGLLTFSFMDHCGTCYVSNTYGMQLYMLIVVDYLSLSLAFFCILIDVYLSLERIFILQSKVILIINPCRPMAGFLINTKNFSRIVLRNF